MSVERSKEIRKSINSATTTLTSTLSTSLGPRSFDKLIYTKSILVTNDGATILKNLIFHHPINKVLSNLSQSQDSKCGDGTTSVVVLCGSLLECSLDENLLEKVKNVCLDYINRIKIYIGDTKYVRDPRDIGNLNENSNNNNTSSNNKNTNTRYVRDPKEIGNLNENSNINNTSSNNKNTNSSGNNTINCNSINFKDQNYKKYLIDAVNTALSSKVISSSSLEFSPVAVESVILVNGNIKNIKIIKKIGGSVDDIKVSKSIILKNNIKNINSINKETINNKQNNFVQLNNKENINNKQNNLLQSKLKVAILQFCISPPKTNIDYKITIKKSDQMEKIVKEEREYILNLCKDIKKSGADLVLVQKSILRESLDELGLFFLSKLGVYAVEVDREEVQFISENLGLKCSVDSEIIHTKEFIVNEYKENEATITEIESANTCSVLVRGCDNIIIDEVKRSFVDAINVVKCLYEDPYLLPGGGAVEIGIANELEEIAKKDNCFYMKEYSKAFAKIPYYLAKNAGMCAVTSIHELKNKIKENPTMGINVRKNNISCMRKENIVQPKKVSESMIMLALETAMMIHKIDDILPAKK